MANDLLLHERHFRSNSVLERFNQVPITICGAGAIGANLTETLARQGFHTLQVIDSDRIESHNLSTQPWSLNQIGVKKVDALRLIVFSIINVDIKATHLTFDDRNLCKKKLQGNQLIIDAFDNRTSRECLQSAAQSLNIPLLHIGLEGFGYGEVIWDEDYVMPENTGVDGCDYPMARNLIMLTVATAAEIIAKFVTDGTKINRSLTLGDLKIHSDV